MTRALHSRYISHTDKAPVIRKWITMLLLHTDLDSQLLFGHIDKRVLAGFDTSEINRDNQGDVEFMRDWIERQKAQFKDAVMDERDPLAKNTRHIQQSLGLSTIELDILRFACLMHCCTSLEAAVESGSDGFTEVDLCDVLSEGTGHSFHDIFCALHPTALLRESGLVRAGNGGSNCVRQSLSVPALLMRQVIRAQEGDSLLEGVFYRRGPKSRLSARDFRHVGDELKLVRDYLRSSFANRSEGANVLIWGEPGTGKTEMVRYLAQSMRKELLEGSMIDAYHDSISAPARLDCFRLCQAVTQRSTRSLVLFDEVEEILSDRGFAELGFKNDSKMSKGLINTVLESTKTPSIWVTNTVRGVDPAYLRRFDIVLHMKSPLLATKRRIARKVLQDVPLNTAMVHQIADNRLLTPAHLQKVSKICRRLNVNSTADAQAIVEQVLNGDLKAMQAKPLELSQEKKRRPKKALPYRPESINCDGDLDRLAEVIDKDSSVRMCLFGPPGTGKTAWASHLARKINRPLLVKQAAELLGMYVGETEKKIASAFEEASEMKGILLLDEADSFLPDRATASQQWEVSKANQFLTAMEKFEGILICTTNLMGNLDPATLRRFDFKMTFDYLEPEHSTNLAIDLLKLLGRKPRKKVRMWLKQRLSRLRVSHGDYAALLRRYVATRISPTAEQLLADVKSELRFRECGDSRPIGFTATI